MATKTIPQLNNLGVALTASALFEISQTGSFKITLGKIQDFMFTSNWTGNGNINVAGGFVLTASAGMTLEAIGASLILSADTGQVSIQTQNDDIVIQANNNSVLVEGAGQVNILSDNGDVYINAGHALHVVVNDDITFDGPANYNMTIGDSVHMDITNFIDLNPGTDLKINGTAGKSVSIPIVGVGTLVFTKGILTGFP